MFLGCSDHSIDQKGRIILPKEFRDELGEECYITAGFHRCVQVMSKEQFDHLRDQIRQLPADKALSLQYLLISPATKVRFNSQGRIPIPQKLRDDVGLSGDATVVGMDNRVEIWSKQTFDRFIEAQKKDSISDALALLRL